MQKLIFKNGNGVEINLTNHTSYGVTEWEGFSADSLNIQSQQVPFQDGAVFLDALMESRELSVTLAIKDDGDMEKRYRLRRELISVMNPKLGEGVLIYANDFLSKQIHVIPQLPVFNNHNSNDSGTPKASLAWTACNPYWEDINETIIELKNGETKIISNTGDVPIGFQITETLFQNNEISEIKNITTQKSIKLLDSRNNNSVTINTKTGEKIAEGDVYDFKKVINAIFNDLMTKDDRVFVVGNKGLVTEIKNGFALIKNLQTSQNFTSIQYFEEIQKYIVIGVNNVYGSSDFETWEQMALSFIPSGEKVTKIKSVNNKIFIITDSGKLFVSDDLISATDISISGSGGCLDIVYGNNLYVAVVYTRNIIYTSVDLSSWTSVTTNANYLTAVCFYNGVFYAIGYGPNYNYRVFKSENISSWARIDSTFERIELVGIDIIADNLIVYDGTNAYYSMDFVLFNFMGLYKKAVEKNSIEIFAIKTNSIEQGTINELNPIYFEDIGVVNYLLRKSMGEFLMFTSNGIYQTDDISKVKTKISNQYIKKCIYCSKNNTYYGVNNTQNIIYSTDLINWTSVNLYIGTVIDIAYDDESNMFLAIGTSDINVSYSENGVEWTRKAIGYSSTWNHVYSNKGSILMAGNSRIVKFMNTNFSDAANFGATVLALIPPVDVRFRTVLISSENLKISTGSMTQPMVTSDVSNIQDAIYIDSLHEYIAVSSTGKILLSSDGIKWFQIYSNSEYSLTNIFFINDSIHIIGTHNTDNVILRIDYKKNENLISKLSPDSNMNMKIDIGDNEITFICTNGFCNIAYHQKYLGV